MNRTPCTFPKHTLTAKCAGFLGHCKDRLLWLLHNFEALSQPVAIKLWRLLNTLPLQIPWTETCGYNTVHAGSEDVREWFWLKPTIHGPALQHCRLTGPPRVRELGFLWPGFSVRKILFSFFLTHSDLDTVYVSSGWARGLFLVCPSLFDEGIKPQGAASQLDRKQATRFGVGGAVFFFFFFPSKWKNPGMGIV